MKVIALLLFACFFLQDVPYMPKEEFEVKLDYQFKQRPPADPNTIRMNGKASIPEVNSPLLPYLVLNIAMLNTAGASRLHIGSNLSRTISNKKVKEGSVIPVNFGFTNDVKDRVTAHEYTLTLVSEKREEMSKIVLFIDKDGTFLVNGEKRGRF
jgi:hypothetical protein